MKEIRRVITNKEAAKRLRECRNTTNFQPYQYMNEALDKAIELLEKDEDWHVVKDGVLPPSDVDVFVTTESGDTTMSCLNHKSIWECCEKVIAWRYKPESYKKG